MKQMKPKVLHALVGAALTVGILSGSQPAMATEPFLGQIEFYGFNFAPRGWVLCEGQILPINQHQSLYSLLGTTFGGDGRTTFGLPDMRGRSPIHDGGSAGGGLTRRILGSRGGSETVTLTAAEIPSHGHLLRGTTSTANGIIPTNSSLADTITDKLYLDETPNVNMHAGSIGSTPSGAHENMAPFLAINCSIALQGLFPSRN